MKINAEQIVRFEDNNQNIMESNHIKAIRQFEDECGDFERGSFTQEENEDIKSKNKILQANEFNDKITKNHSKQIL